MKEEELLRQVDEQLARKCQSWKYLLSVFLLTTTPGLYNVLHITVYVFLTQPTSHLCRQVQPLLDANFTFQQIRNLSAPGGDCCRVYKWDYVELSGMGYDQATLYLDELKRNGSLDPGQESCTSFLYDPSEPFNLIKQWDLVCDRANLVSFVQVAVAFGKFVGAFCFGIIADKFGRKKCFLMASGLYIIAGPVAAWVSDFSLFLLCRFVIGLAGSAVYETGYVLLSELTVNKWRSRLSCIYGIFYSFGLMLLALIAMNFTSWRLLQLSISLPTFCILINCWFLTESPRWLIIKGRTKEAWEILFSDKDGQNIELQTAQIRGSAEPMIKKQDSSEKRTQEHAWYKKCIVFAKEALQIFSNSELRSRALICNFSWLIASLCYYGIALNGVNLSSNQYAYVALNGVFEAPGYLLPVFLISYLGRKSSSIMSFFISGVSFLIILMIPSGLEGLRTVWALVGRMWVSSVFSFISLHTAELFPTSNRNTAFGLNLAMSQIGSMAAPYLVQSGETGWYVPSTICGCLALIAGSFILLLPETKNQPLSDTIQDVEKANKVSLSNCCSIFRSDHSS